MRSRSLISEAALAALPALLLLALEILWATGSAPVLPFPPRWFPVVLLVPVVCALGATAGLRGLARVVPRWTTPVGFLASGAVLAGKLYLAGLGSYPLTFIYFLLPLYLFARFRRHLLSRDTAPLFWALALTFALTMSTDIPKNIMSLLQLTLGNVTSGVVVMLVHFAVLEIVARSLDRAGEWILRHRVWAGGMASVVLLGAFVSWASTGVYARLPTGLEDFEPGFHRFRGDVPSTTLAGDRDPEELPNIILISIDTLRWDQTPLHDTALRIPAMRTLYRDSLVFSNHFASEVWTLPTHASLFSGRLPWRHGAVDLGYAMYEDVSTFPQRLQELGYTTAGFTGGRFLGRNHGFARGFDTYRVPPFEEAYDRFLPGGVQYLALFGVSTSSGVPVKVGAGATNQGPQRHQRLENKVRRAKRWLRQSRQRDGGPFFLFLHTYQVHDYNHIYSDALQRLNEEHPPLAVPFGSTASAEPEWKQYYEELQSRPSRFLDQELIHGDEERLKRIVGTRHSRDPDLQELRHWQTRARRVLRGLWKLYRYGIEETDESLGDFLDFLRARDLYRPSLIVFLSDHGEGFLLRSDALGHHGGQHQDTLIRIPLAVKLPGNRHAGRRIGSFVQLSDVYPMIFEHLGIQSKPPPTVGRRPDGTRILRADTGGRRVVVGSGRPQPLRPPRFVVRGGRFKLIRGLNGSMEDYRRVRSDRLPEASVPGGRVPPSVRNALDRTFEELLNDYRSSRRPYENPKQKLSPEKRQELKALGYLR